MPRLVDSIALLASTASLAHAWGALGHDTVAYVATNFVSSATEAWAQDILDDTTASYLANVATWADSYRSTTAGKFSAPFHFIDAEDNPPSSCSVNYSRDCGNSGCVVSAIANYTSRVTSNSLSADEVNDALRFIIHFIGDIHQPLHDEALELGGNGIDVTFDSTSTNLHAIWDTNMPEKLRGGYSLTVAKTWAANLTMEIKTGIYKSQKASWTSGLDVTDPIDTTIAWATQANAYVCSTVLKGGQSAVEKGDLGTTYYESAVPVIEVQIGRAGVRLAAWLDAIVASQTNKTEPRQTVEPRELQLMGMDFLPAEIEMSKAKLARAAVGHGCKH